MLNKPSLAISVVGRTGSFFGALILLPLYLPDIIRICQLPNKVRSMVALSFPPK